MLINLSIVPYVDHAGCEFMWQFCAQVSGLKIMLTNCPKRKKIFLQSGQNGILNIFGQTYKLKECFSRSRQKNFIAGSSET